MEKNVEEDVVALEGHVDVRFLSSSKLYSLVLHQIRKDQGGKYTLKLKNIAGEAEASTHVTVNYPPLIVRDLESLSVTEGSECSFLAVVEGFPKPTVEWFKGEAKLKADKRLVVGNNEGDQFSLTIHEAKNADKGAVRAVFKNKVGVA